MTALTPPASSTLRQLQPADGTGALFAAATLVSTAAGVWLSTRPEALVWAAGQLVLAASLVVISILLFIAKETAPAG